MSIAIKSFVLSTGLEVYDTAKKIFPNIKAKVVMQDDRPQMKLIFNNSLETLFIANAVERKAFKKELVLLESSLLGSTIVYPLNPDTFTLAEPLSNWGSFRREMYERKKKKCVDVLIAYLSASEDEIIIKQVKLKKLEKLELAPEQVEHHLTKEIEGYFFQVLDKLQNMEPSLKLQIIQNLRDNYPNAYKRMLSEASDRIQAKNPKKENIALNIEKQLCQRVYGQEKATKQLATLLSMHENQEKNGVYLFIGPTGVGKTELAKAVSEVKKYTFVFLEMQQCTDEMGVTKFWGAGAGYVGSTDRPHFMKELDKCTPKKVYVNAERCSEIKNAVILFDELEKAHKKVQQSLLTLLDEGHCTFSYTNGYTNVSLKYRFNNCIFIATSNLFQAPILEAFQQGRETSTIAQLFKDLNGSGVVRESYSLELLGRMEIVPFGPIAKGACYQKMVKSKLEGLFAELKTSYNFKEIALENEEVLLEFLETKLYGNGTDVRTLKRFLAKNMNDIIADNQNKWGDLEQIKLTLSCLDRQFTVKAFLFIETFNDYHCIGTYQK